MVAVENVKAVSVEGAEFFALNSASCVLFSLSNLLSNDDYLMSMSTGEVIEKAQIRQAKELIDTLIDTPYFKVCS